MDANWFDTLTKSVSRPGSRRRVMRLGAALPLAGAAGRLLGTSFAGADKVTAENCTPAGKRCGKGKRQQPCKKCCTGNVITDQSGRKRCSCVRLGNGCSNDSQCCEGICDAGTCQTSDPGPDPVLCTGLKPTQDLQEAIDGAGAGDTLTLCAGTWNLTSTVAIDKNLTLIGAGAGKTILDGGNAVRVLLINTAAPVRVQDLTITKGYEAVSGGGIYNYGVLTLRGVSVTGNAADQGGGGIWNHVGTVTLKTGTSVTGNTSGTAGGGIFNYTGPLTLEDGSSVTGNTAVGNGGGISNDGGPVTLKTGSSVTGNTAGGIGGGVHNDEGTVTLEGTDTPSPIVVNNCTDNCGGAPAVTNCAVTPVSCS
jgi:hypothetical protein